MFNAGQVQTALRLSIFFERSLLIAVLTKIDIEENATVKRLDLIQNVFINFHLQKLTNS